VFISRLWSKDAAVEAIADALRRPEVVAVAIQVGLETSVGPDAASAAAKELRAIDRVLRTLRSDEAAAVQGQIAGIRAGASPDAYADVFAEIAAKRKDMEQRGGTLKRILRANADPAGGTTAKLSEVYQMMFEDTLRVLTTESVSGATKRAAVGIVIDKVVCNKQGGDVYFIPGIFGESGDSYLSRSTFQTTCIGIKTQK
jgi:hypothetical protein